MACTQGEPELPLPTPGTIWTAWQYLVMQPVPLSSPTGNFCGTPAAFVVFSPLSHGLWLSLVERLNGVQEVPGSNPGSPIFRILRELLRLEEVCKDCGAWEVLQFAGGVAVGFCEDSRKFLLAAKRWRGTAKGDID
jgi:hypothetical protein